MLNKYVEAAFRALWEAIVVDLAAVQTSADNAATLAGAVLTDLHSKQHIYPELAAPIALPANGVAWTYGALTQIIPINTITSDYSVDFISISAMSANASYSIRFTYGAGDTEWAFSSMTRAAVRSSAIVVPIRGIIIPANSIFKGQLADSVGTSTLSAKVYYHLSP